MKKAIFFDIDGTLLDGSRGLFTMSDNTRIHIRQLQQNGDLVFIASGRPFAFLYEDLLQFGFDGFILMNGACVRLHDKTIYKQALPQDYVEEICRTCEKHGVEYILLGEQYVYLDKRFRRLNDFYTAFRMPKEYFTTDFSLSETTNQVFKIEFSPENEQQRKICRALGTNEIASYMEDPRLNFHFEIYSREVSKGAAIVKTLDYLGIDRQNSYAFGDGQNDIEMLSTVGHSFAMGNATQEVQKKASHVVASVYEDGVAQGIAQYILG